MFDLAVIGAGAAGIALTKLALKNKLKVVLIEKDPSAFGGTCINRGCIPTKFLLNSSHYSQDWETLVSQKDALIKKIKEPLLAFLEKNGIQILWGRAAFVDEHTLSVDGKIINAKNIVIATGSSPRQIIQSDNALAGEEFLARPSLPSNALIVGAGYIGIEFATLLNSFKRTVTVIEKEDRILPFMDSGLAQRLSLVLQKKGIKIATSADASKVDPNSFDLVVTSVGRTANIDALALDKAGVVIERGFIKVDSRMRTNTSHIYACGDANGRKMLAYVAEYQAYVCLANIMGQETHEDYAGIAECVFSIPQIAKVGMLIDEAKQKNLKVKVIQSNFFKYSSAYVYEDTEGFMQVVLGEDDTLLGAAIISNKASELISVFSLAIRKKLKLSDLQSCFFIHPTLSEIIPSLLRG